MLCHTTPHLTLLQGLVAGCPPCTSTSWLSSPSHLLTVSTSFHLLGALPASLLPVRCVSSHHQVFVVLDVSWCTTGCCLSTS